MAIYNHGTRLWLTKERTVRILIGLMGVALPLLLLCSLWLTTGYDHPRYSTSHYYYTRVGGIFIIIISQLAVFLLVYRGLERVDFFVSSAACGAVCPAAAFPD